MSFRDKIKQKEIKEAKSKNRDKVNQAFDMLTKFVTNVVSK